MAAGRIAPLCAPRGTSALRVVEVGPMPEQVGEERGVCNLDHLGCMWLPNAPELSRGAQCELLNQSAWRRRRLQLIVRRCGEHGLEVLARGVVPVAWPPRIDGHWRELVSIRTDYRQAVTTANVSGINGSHRHRCRRNT